MVASIIIQSISYTDWPSLLSLVLDLYCVAFSRLCVCMYVGEWVLVRAGSGGVAYE